MFGDKFPFECKWVVEYICDKFFLFLIFFLCFLFLLHGILIRVMTDVVRVSDIQGKNREFRFLWSDPNWRRFVGISTKEPDCGISLLFDSESKLKLWKYIYENVGKNFT